MPEIQPYRDALRRRQVIDPWTTAFGRGTGHNDPDLSIDRKLAVEDGLFFVALHGDGVVGSIPGA